MAEKFFFFKLIFFSFGKPVLCNALAIFVAPKRAGGGDFCLAGAAVPLPPTPLFRRL